VVFVGGVLLAALFAARILDGLIWRPYRVILTYYGQFMPNVEWALAVGAISLVAAATLSAVYIRKRLRGHHKK
jgi:hypothetical protein